MKQFFLLGSVMLLLLSACKGPAVFSETNLLPHMKQPTLVLLSGRPALIPRNEWTTLLQEVEAELQAMPQFGTLLVAEAQQQIWQQAPHLKPAQAQYQATLAATGVSDKALAQTLREAYGTSRFLLFQFESYSCTKECAGTRQWLIRLTVLNPESGKPVYRIRTQRQLTPDEEQPDVAQALARTLIRDLLQQFESEFTVPWHQWRFEHLRRPESRIERASTGL